MFVQIEPNDDGFLASCPQIQGAFAEGETEFEAFYNLVDVLQGISEYRKTTHRKKQLEKKKLEFEIPIGVE